MSNKLETLSPCYVNYRWKEKPAGEYGSEEVEILFTAVYSTVNELAEMAHIEQGRSVKDLLIKLVLLANKML